MDTKISRFSKIYPWYAGITSDLLFYTAIDTLFLTVVKKFSAAQIVSMTSVAVLACIVLQFPLLKLIQRVGNTASARLGALSLLASSLCIMFGPNYYFVVLGRIFHEIAAILRNVSYVTLENNLELIGKQHDFIRLRASGNIVYAVITMLISFFASLMFNFNNYLPMIACVASAAIGFVLSFFMVDYSKYNITTRKKNAGGPSKFKYSKLIVLIILVYGLFYAIVQSDQADGKLLIQQQLLLDFSLETTSLIIGIILCVSRIIRVLSNLAFPYIYRKGKTAVGILLPSLLCLSVALLLFGSLSDQIRLKIILMGIGYILVLFVRDPFRLFIQDILLDNSDKENHQTLLTILEFAVKTATAALSLSFALALLKYPLLVVMAILLVLALVEVVLSIRLYHLLRPSKATVPA